MEKNKEMLCPKKAKENIPPIDGKESW